VSPTPTPGAHEDAGDLYGGTFSTEKLDATAEVLRREGWSEESIRRRVYVPFIVVGPASWSDSWGDPRFGPGPIVRSHEGQDVICHYGADVLASEDGVIEFDTGLLGGRSARLHRPGGDYWYYAHLSDWNLDAFSTGDAVHAGDVIGYCGSTGNATVPHVHFGHYGPDGEAIDPMVSLVSWLHEAESRLGDVHVGTSTQVPAATEALAPIEPPPSLIPLLEGQAAPQESIGDTGPAVQAFVRAEGRDGAFELTLVWVAVIFSVVASRVCGRLVVARRKRTS
jgi:murein DD-endopeptidase MepM/ murein hydrolase activator NlpD